MCRLSWNLGASTSWNPQGLPRPVMGLLYFLQLKRTKQHVINQALIIVHTNPLYSISRFCKAGYIEALTLTAASLSLLYFLCWASPCGMLQISILSWFCIASAYCVHNSVMNSSNCRILNASRSACALENCQSCVQACFPGAALLKDTCLPQIPRRGGSNEYFIGR